MSIVQLLRIFLLLVLFIPACTKTESKQPATTFKEVPEIQEIKPEKPLKIKLKRNAKNDYSWEINGDNVDEIIKTDKRLKKAFGSE
ncbi:MAG: hypothetical protein HY752_03755 [Nitrospirae bacterium]|nr:hypothetical protein [Nitrospirota bacterium]